ncbi:MAG: hypothetical protein UHD09_04520 [Bifidobacterium sp.]|nr:hypothetical protein [Bifidobacterium sp.]
MAAEDVTNKEEGLDAVSEDQVEAMKEVVDETDHPYTDPITGKPNEDVPHDELGVTKQSEERKLKEQQADQMAVNEPEEEVDSNQWGDPYLEDTVNRHLDSDN